VETVPMGRFGVPADVAAAVVFLASDGPDSSPANVWRSTVAT
jgi:NAD(P)-dependent dehydrogenase (short-subunit alcohol dehydrogenase family)